MSFICLEDNGMRVWRGDFADGLRIGCKPSARRLQIMLDTFNGGDDVLCRKR